MDLNAHRNTPEAFWGLCQAWGMDGYDVMEAAHTRGWHPLPAWGPQQHDLGSWPLVVIYARNRPEGFDLAEYVEGDVTCWTFMSSPERHRGITELAHRWRQLTNS